MLPIDGTPTTDNALLAASLGAAILHATQLRAPPSYPRLASKTVPTALLSILTSARGSSSLLAAALALSATGDAFLAWNDSDGSFLGGLTSFLAAHVLYIVLLSRSSSYVRLLGDGWRVGFAALLAAVVVPGMIALLMPRVERALRVPIVVYTTAIAVMVLKALGVDDGWVVAGAGLFAASDGILAAERFLVSRESAHRAWMPYAVWGLYYSGQLLIALALSEPMSG